MMSAGTAQDCTITKTPLEPSRQAQTPNPWAFGPCEPAGLLQNLNRNRFYRPDLGRFLSSDPVADYPYYLYAYNLPLTFVDPYGMKACCKCQKIDIRDKQGSKAKATCAREAWGAGGTLGFVNNPPYHFQYAYEVDAYTEGPDPSACTFQQYIHRRMSAPGWPNPPFRPYVEGYEGIEWPTCATVIS